MRLVPSWIAVRHGAPRVFCVPQLRQLHPKPPSAGDGSLPSSVAAARKKSEVNFVVVHGDATPGEYGSAADPSPYISLAQPEEDLRDLQHAYDVVIPHASIEVEVDYPLFRPFVFHVQAPNGAQAFTRRALAQSVSDLYHRIYAEEERTSSTGNEKDALYTLRDARSAATVAGQGTDYEKLREIMPWQGRYGIWGHDLGDLMLHTVYFNAQEGMWQLGIDS